MIRLFKPETYSSKWGTPPHSKQVTPTVRPRSNNDCSLVLLKKLQLVIAIRRARVRMSFLGMWDTRKNVFHRNGFHFTANWGQGSSSWNSRKGGWIFVRSDDLGNAYNEPLFSDWVKKRKWKEQTKDRSSISSWLEWLASPGGSIVH